MIKHSWSVICDRSGNGETDADPVCLSFGADTLESACACAKANGWLVEEGVQLCRRHRNPATP